MTKPLARAWRLAPGLPRNARTISQWLAKCPEPTCDCQATPPGLDIDHDGKMSFSPYREHILVCTGQDDWVSKIELDTRAGPVTRHLKALLGPPHKRGQRATTGGVVPGRYHNPYSPHMITNASFPSSITSAPSAPSPPAPSFKDDLPMHPTSLYLFPSFTYVTLPPALDPGSYSSTLDSLIQHHVHRSILKTSPLEEEKEVVLQQLDAHAATRVNLGPRPVDEVIILICGHGGRDSRCGALGLPLQKEFEDKLQDASVEVLPHARGLEETASSSRAARVGLISHIGGHKWAGNVIIYIPPRWSEREGHPLRGSAIWYGRVEPRHVEGIVKETVLEGRLVEELWRGGMHLSKGPQGVAWTAIRGPSQT